jgi:hypothetical protein
VNLDLEALVLGSLKLREAEVEVKVIEHAPVEEEQNKLTGRGNENVAEVSLRRTLVVSH